MKLEILHSTRYRYSAPIAETVMEVRLQPMDGNGQRCTNFRLELSHGVKPRTYMDGYGNNVHYFNLVRPHSGLSVISRSTVETGLAPDDDPGEELVQDFLRFRFPWSLPYVFVGLKVAIALAVIGAVVGEFVGATKGLGYVIVASGQNANTTLAFAAIVLLSLMSILLYYAVALLERVLVPWSEET
jgi:transglutaminase-like putative cysteine protease